MLIFRYIASQLIKTTLMVLLFLFLIMLSNRFVWVLADASAGKIPQDVILEFLALQIPRFLSLMIPVGFSLAALATIYKMNNSHEMEVILSSGISKSQVISRVILLSFGFAILTGTFSLWLAPWAKSHQEQLKLEHKETLARSFLSAGQFQELPGPTKKVVYVEALGDDQQMMHNVLVLRTPGETFKAGDKSDVLSAKQGYFLEGDSGQSRKLILEGGVRYQGYAGQLDFGITEFAKLTIPIAVDKKNVDIAKRGAKPSTLLMESEHPKDKAELFWRFSMPISAVILVLLAMSTIRLETRSEKAGKLVSVILMILLYFNLIAMFRSWIEREMIGVTLSLFLLHGSFVLAGIVWAADPIERQVLFSTIRAKLFSKVKRT